MANIAASFKYSQEELEFKNTLRSFFEEEISSSYLRKRIEEELVTDRSLRERLNGLGLVEFFSDPDSGGFRELCLIAEECGRSLFTEPLIEELFFGPYLLGRLGASAALERVKGGEILAGVVSASRHGSARAPEARYLPGAVASDLIAVYRQEGDKLIGDLYDTARCKLTPVATLDRTIKYSHVTLHSEPAATVSSSALSITPLLSTLKAAEIYGAASKALELTLSYVGTRKQYGVPVGGFQAVQHGLAEAYLKLESLRALILFASWAATYSEAQFALASYAAFIRSLEVGPSVVEAAIQYHGGIGFTWEYDLHLYLRRVKMIEALYRPGDDMFQDILNEAVKAA